MQKLIAGLLIFTAGWSLGRYTLDYWETDPTPTAKPDNQALLNPVSPERAAVEVTPTAPDNVKGIVNLLQSNEFEAVLEDYELLRDQAGEAVVEDARVRILSHASRLIADGRFSAAEQLLQLFLVAAYRDAEARVLLAEAYRGQEDFYAAIDQLYAARGYAYRANMLGRITKRIRSLVAELTQSLERNNNNDALLVLYQHLIQLEPDYARYFIGLASIQLALDDKEAARRSLLLVSQDSEVGVQARAMLSELAITLAETQDTEKRDAAIEVAGIPLRRSGNHYIVDATPAHGQSIRLLIDTGASLTILTPDVLEQRGIRYQNTGRTAVFSTANGPVRAPIYKLDSLTVGDWQVNQLEIGVLELDGRSAMDGLLGMNFLNHFRFFIDQNEASLRLSTH